MSIQTVTDTPAAVTFDGNTATVDTKHGPIHFKGISRSHHDGGVYATVEGDLTFAYRRKVQVVGNPEWAAVCDARGAAIKNEVQADQARAVVSIAWRQLLSEHGEQMDSIADAAVRAWAVNALATRSHLQGFRPGKGDVISGLKGMADRLRKEHQLRQIATGVKVSDLVDLVVTLEMVLFELGPVDL